MEKTENFPFLSRFFIPIFIGSDLYDHNASQQTDNVHHATLMRQPQGTTHFKEKSMGDKGGRKDKEKSQKQNSQKEKQKEQAKRDKQPQKKA